MENRALKVLKLINDTINSKSVSQNNFYKDSLQTLEKLFKADYWGIYFIDIDKFTVKDFLSDKTKQPLPLGHEFLEILNAKNKQSTVFENYNFKSLYSPKYLLVSRLFIKNSIFGIVCAGRNNEFDEFEIQSFESIASVISYLIKDYELNDVFKMQLKALQDAVIEKDNAYETIEKQHKKLIELDKTKNAFLANISHELRTPLNAIIGFSQALGCKIFGELNEKQEEYIKDIQISSLHLLGMINEILDISKIESKAMKISPGELSPHIVIQEVINILSPLSEQKSLNVDFIDKCNANIVADYQKLQQIMYNLLSNAIKFTPQNGKIQIRINKDGKDFILEVQDNGIGIDKKFHNKIFTKFVHLNNIYTKSQSSTGLGLTITKELVKLHRGKITLESAPNKGTTFKVVLKKAVI